MGKGLIVVVILVVLVLIVGLGNTSASRTTS